jgi:ComF family protein
LADQGSRRPPVKIKGLAAVAEPLLGLIYPNICQICRIEAAVRKDGFICPQCRLGADGVKPVRPPYCTCCGLPFEGAITISFKCANCHDRKIYFRSARAAAEFSGVVKAAIHSYKYNHAIWFEVFLGRLLAEEAGPALQDGDWDWIIPIPLHWTRRLERSFNQSERLARGLSRATGIPVNARFLRRKERTGTQARLSRLERAENVKRAFAFRGAAPLNGARIVLIDDVLTTGATASACAKVLLDHGASVIDVWTIARDVLR